ncbi:P-loop NTPase fold protein [Crassaminicella profunda]|uniref:P-loop NTPase fold protein n=1 Tax=Crassaminicella profunda TaxID=1286698 RepID=UPI001CA6EE22|nr:P-loop NTPase fold protein [Crassaminicella profunda]QZY56845.1 KAP family NTPase [Crassaminicella profunda]
MWYNAWESDYNEDALMPIINEIYNQDSFEDKKEEIKKKTVNLLKYVGKNITKKIITEKFGKEIEEVLNSIKEHGLNAEKLEEILRENPSNKYFDEFLQFKEVKDKFTGFLQELSSDKKIIFFIDELDRCRPTFSIETLEIIKHFFNINNFIFIIALDMEQLSYSVKTIYGKNMDTCGYLRRFFDLHFKIPKPKVIDYVEFVLKNNNLNIKNYNFIENISNIFDKLGLSLREINSILKNYQLVLDTSLRPYIENNEYLVLEVYLYLITLKYKEPYYYNVILYKSFIQEGNSPGNLLENPIAIPKNIFEPTPNIKKFS